ncbi:histone H3.v1-like isoform X2 [Periplaneta americana]|uniref:histone H3.v1-like isoform X2 n=1 Tax=Periplaneta americana TaxID=6978 RepID=UPI0037E7CE52
MKREPKVNVPIQLTGRPHTPSHRQSNAIPCPAQSRPSSCHESCPGLPQGGRPSSARSTPADQPETRRHSAPPGHPTSSQRRSGMSRHTAVPEPGPSRRVRMSAPRSSSPMRRQVSQEAATETVLSSRFDNLERMLPGSSQMLDDIEEPEFASDISDDSDVRDPNIQLQRSRELQPSSPRSGTMGLPRRSPAQSPQRFQPSPPPTLDKLQRSPEWSPVFDLSHYEMLDDIGQPEFPPDISSEDADIVDPNIQSQRSPVVSPHRMQPSTSPAATSDQSRRSPPVAHSSPHQAARLDQTQQSSAQSPLFDLSQYEALEHRDPHIQQQPLPAEPSPQQAPLLDRTPVRSATEQTTSAEEKRSEEQEEARFRMLQRLLQTSTGKDSYLDTIEPPPLAPARVEDEDSSQLWQDIRDYRDDVLLPATETTRRRDLQDTDFLMSGIQRLPEFFDESSKSRTTQPAPQPASERLVAHSRPSLARRIPVPVTRQPPTAQPAAPAVRRYISTGRPVSAPQEPVAQRPVSVQATSTAHQPAHAISRPVSAQPAPSVRRPVSPRTPSAARRLVTAQTTPTSAQVTKVQPSPASVYSPVTREIRRPLSTPSRTRPQAQETRGSGIPVAFRPKIGLQTETRPTTVLPRSYDEDLTGTYIRVPRPGTVPPPSFQQRDFPFKSELSPVQPVYPYPTTQPQADILSGVPVSGPREGEVEPEFPVPSTSRQVPPIPGTSRDQPMRIDLDRKVGQYGFDDKSWHDTEVALTHLEMDLEKATEQMMRNIETALGEGVDEFQVLEALLDKGIPEETVSRTVARKYGRRTRGNPTRNCCCYDAYRGTWLASWGCSPAHVQLLVQN